MRLFPYAPVTLLLCLCLPIAHARAPKPEPLPLEALQRFTVAIDHIRNYYVKPAEDEQLFEDAIRGMLTGLDPHSAYLDAEEFADLQVNTSGQFGGLGIEVTLEDHYIRVITPIDDTPAQKGGIKAGDMIIKINDTPVKGLSLRRAVEKMRGKPSTEVELTILRPHTNQPLKMTLTREIIKVQSVRKKVMEQHYGYLRISQFQSHTANDLIDAIKALKKETSGQLKGIILDLRNNPGGVLEASVKVSDAFLDKKKLTKNHLIVYTESRIPSSEIKEYATNGDILAGLPIVVLVNNGSASASEIVAGALQDHQRALVLGTPTFGKGSVQTVLPLKDQRGLKLTTALYYTPLGRSIQATGILPDIEVENLLLTASEHQEPSWVNLKERHLTGHLSNGSADPNEVTLPPESAEEMEEESRPLVMRDYQLNEAFNLLRGLSLTRHIPAS